jgi:phosphohistidine swiveling domain-containing protein
MKATKFEKVMSRDTSVIMTEVWQTMFTAAAAEMENPIPSPIFIYRGGITESWRPTDLFFSQVPRAFAAWLGRSPKHLEKVLMLMKRYRYFAKLVKNFKINKKNIATILQGLKQIVNYSNLAAPGLFAAYWMPFWHREKQAARFPSVILKKGDIIRKTDSLFDDGNDAVDKLLRALSGKLSISASDLRLLNLQELETYCSNSTHNRFRQIIRKRKRGYFMYENQIYSLASLKNFLKQKLFILHEPNLPNRRVLTGQIAYPGLVQGRVKVVFNRQQAAKVRKGDILVATMTTPWFIPLMQKAAAYVTDEGGIMCHAAVIAREYKKPCVIGTKIATKVLRDGDLVEVNANQGRVRKL